MDKPVWLALSPADTMYSHPTGRRRPLSAGPRFLLRHLWAYASSAVVRVVPAVRSASPGADPCRPSRQAAIYVSFDRAGILADFVVAQVAELATSGRRVMFISTSPRVSAADIERLRPHVWEIVHRRNLGHDFGAYKDGIARLGDLRNLDSLVLMNDSCYGPFGGLARVEAAAAASGADLFGITDSWSIRYHLQTYYVWIGAAALRSPAMAGFWRSLLPSQPRSMVISNGEVRFTQALLKAGLTTRVLCPYSDAARHALAAAERRLAEPDALLEAERNYLQHLVNCILAGAPLNPTHSFWDVLLSECGSPFIKRELLRKNPVRIPRVPQWEDVVGRCAGADLDMIRDHLKLG